MNLTQNAHTRRPDYTVDPRYAYLEWLRMEARLLQLELMPEAESDRDYSPVGTFAKGFHFPLDRGWQGVPKPSTRAVTVLEAVGIKMPTRRRRLARVSSLSETVQEQ